MSEGILEALQVIEDQKGISKEIIIEAIETALISAYKKNFGQTQNVEVVFNRSKDQFEIYQSKKVVEEVEDPSLEIALTDAQEKNPVYEPGDVIKFLIEPTSFGRIAAQTAKQVITQRVREEERNLVYDEFIQYEDDLLQGVVERMDNRFIYINLGKIEAALSKHDRIPNEDYRPHDRIKVYVSKVENTTKGPQVYVSRTHPNLVKRLFEQEVPEVFDGIVEIKSIAREAGDRSKVAVYADDSTIDPVGTCVGPRGQRVQNVVNELNGENMDIIEWDTDPAVFITNALKPADVVDVHFINEEETSCIVVVPDHQLSLAIGKRGQNVRLAARLTNCKIDIKSESDMNDFDLEAAKALAASEESADQKDVPEIENEQEPAVQENLTTENLEAVIEEVEEIEEEEMDESMESALEKEDYETGELSSEQAEDMADLGQIHDEYRRIDEEFEESEAVDEEAVKDDHDLMDSIDEDLSE